MERLLQIGALGPDSQWDYSMMPSTEMPTFWGCGFGGGILRPYLELQLLRMVGEEPQVHVSKQDLQQPENQTWRALKAESKKCWKNDV